MLLIYCSIRLIVDIAVDAILSSGATDKVGDGKIFVLPCDEAYRIRTGEGTKSLN